MTPLDRGAGQLRRVPFPDARRKHHQPAHRRVSEPLWRTDDGPAPEPAVRTEAIADATSGAAGRDVVARDGGDRASIGRQRRAGRTDADTDCTDIRTEQADTVPFVDLATQYAAIEEEIDAASAGGYARADFILGAEVEALRGEFAAFCDAIRRRRRSGTSALELVCGPCVGPGDEVITVANTFIATAWRSPNRGYSRSWSTSIRDRTCSIRPSCAARSPRGPGDRAGPPVRPAGRHGSDHGDRARHGLMVDRGCLPRPTARGRGRRAGRRRRRRLQLLPVEEPRRVRRRRYIVTTTTGRRRGPIAAQLRPPREVRPPESASTAASTPSRRRSCGSSCATSTVEWRRRPPRRATMRARLAGTTDRPAGRAPRPSGTSTWSGRHAATQCGHLAERGIATGVHYPIPIHLQPAYADSATGAATSRSPSGRPARYCRCRCTPS